MPESTTYALTQEATIAVARLRLQPKRGPFKPDFQTSLDQISATADRVIRSLPVEQRCVWAFRYLEGKTMPEVAEIIGLSVDACWDLHDAASATLRRAIAASPDPLCFKSWPPA